MCAPHHLAATVLAVILQPALLAAADPMPVRLLESCEVFDVGKQAEPATCARCKPGYQLSRTRTCLRLGDFGSTRDSVLRGIQRR